MVKYLVTQGADVWARDDALRTALHHAAQHGHAACVHALLDSMPPVEATRAGIRFIEARSKAGLSPLMYAALYGCTDAAAALLRHGANLYACTTFAAWGLPGSPRANSNVLACAALGKSLACATLLLRYHAAYGAPRGACDPRRACTEEGKTPWQLATEQRLPDLAALLAPGYDLSGLLPLQPDEALIAGAPGSSSSSSSSRLAPAGSSCRQEREGARGVPCLAVLAAGVLRRTLQAELAAVSELQAQLGPYAHGGAEGTTDEGLAPRVPSCSPPLALALAVNKDTLARAQSSSAGGAADVSARAGVHNACDSGPRADLVAMNACSDYMKAGLQPEGLPPELHAALPAQPAAAPTSLTLALKLSCSSTDGGLARGTLARLSQALPAAAGAAREEAGRVDGKCGVCWYDEAVVSLAPCRHVLCVRCMGHLCGKLHAAPLACPFCRTCVSHAEHVAVTALAAYAATTRR